MSSHIEEYYKLLDVPLTATYNEIKAHYKQLVRIYHPDRFRDAGDKAYAEEKLKQLNIAFHFLSGAPLPVAEGMAAAPQPIVYPPIVDFGLLYPGAKGALALQVGNLGGPVSRIQVHCDSKPGVFHLSKGKRLYADRPFPLQYRITVDTKRLRPETAYQEWLEIALDDVVTRVEVRLWLGAVPSLLHDIAWIGCTLRRLALLVVILVFSLLTMTSPPLDLLHYVDDVAATTSLRRPFAQVTEGDLLFTIQEKAGPIVYRWQDGDSKPTALGIRGRAAVGSVVGQRVAYVGKDGEVHVLALRSGQTLSLLQDGAIRRALTWAPDGERLAYLAGEGAQSHIGLYHIATGIQTWLPGAPLPAGVSHYAWAPDGRTLLLEQWQGRERRLYTIRIDGKGLQPLTKVDSWGGAWSPDGQWLVISTPQGIYRLDRAGVQRTQLHDAPGEQTRWSADGQWLAYHTSTANTGQTLWVLQLGTGQATMVSSESVNFAWSPTGNRLGYVTGRAATGAQDEPPLLFLWTVTPGQAPRLIAEINDPIFHWAQ